MYCTTCASPPMRAWSGLSTISRENLAPSSRRRDSGPKPMTVTFLPSTNRVLCTSAPQPSVQKRTALAMLVTGTVTRCRKRAEPSRT
eukprot:scaffold242380_cov26-Tisochrysis_lutea.AAC.1